MKRSLAAALAATVIAGCATTPEPCTAEWVDWKTERIVGEFVADHAKEFKDAQAFSTMLAGMGGLEDPKNPSLMFLTATGVLTLALDFMKDVWPQAQDALAECATAPRATQLFASVMRSQGVDERAIDAIEKIGTLLDTGG